MKIFYSKKAKWLTGCLIGVFILIIVLLNVLGYIFDCKYISAIAAMAQVNKYEVRSELLMDAMNQVGVCSPEATAEVWSNGLKMRSAALQYSVMSSQLKEEYAKRLEESAPNWVTGMSSPWVESYQITKTTIQNKNQRMITLIISTATSTGPAGDYNATLTVVREGDFWRITKIAADKELYPYLGF